MRLQGAAMDLPGAQYTSLDHPPQPDLPAPRQPTGQGQLEEGQGYWTGVALHPGSEEWGEEEGNLHKF